MICAGRKLYFILYFVILLFKLYIVIFFVTNHENFVMKLFPIKAETTSFV